MNRSLLALIPAVAVATLLSAGCGAVAEAQPHIAPAAQSAPVTQSTPATQSAPLPKSAPQQATGAQKPGASASDMEAAADGLRPFLLTPAEIGPGFTAGDEPKPDPAQPAICGGPGVVAQFPYAVRIGAAAERGRGLVQETVSVYGDAGSAAAAYQASLAGMDCSEGSIGGKPVVLAPAEDLGFDLPYDEATGWRIGGDGFDVVMISVRDDAVVVNITVLAPEDALPTLPDPLVVAQAAAQKLLG
jgi:hypothetical protein